MAHVGRWSLGPRRNVWCAVCERNILFLPPWRAQC